MVVKYYSQQSKQDNIKFYIFGTTLKYKYHLQVCHVISDDI